MTRVIDGFQPQNKSLTRSDARGLHPLGALVRTHWRAEGQQCIPSLSGQPRWPVPSLGNLLLQDHPLSKSLIRSEAKKTTLATKRFLRVELSDPRHANAVKRDEGRGLLMGIKVTGTPKTND